MTRAPHSPTTGSSVELSAWERRFPILAILNPREHGQTLTVTGTTGLASAAVALALGWPLWKAVALFVVVLVIPLWITWRADARRFGVTAAVAGALVTVQGLHTVEHIAQWWQRHVFGLSLRDSNGLLSPANSEWVHFVWNWLVVLAVAYLLLNGMRGAWGWALMIWAVGHTLEHTYMFVRFLEVSADLETLGVGGVTAQGLPGILGDGGWLDLNLAPRLGFLHKVPFLTNANRVDVHFMWNAGEMALLLGAVHRLLLLHISGAPRLAPEARNDADQHDAEREHADSTVG